jgi:hypothetical protein
MVCAFVSLLFKSSITLSEKKLKMIAAFFFDTRTPEYPPSAATSIKKPTQSELTVLVGKKLTNGRCI